MKKNYYILLLLTIFLNYNAVFSNGFHGAEQIIALDARMMSLADSFNSLSDNIESVYYNPAGLTHIQNIIFSCSYMPIWDNQTSIYFFSMAFPNKHIPFGIGFLNISTDGILVRSNSPEVDHKTSYQNITGLLSGAYYIQPYISIGLRLKFDYKKILYYNDWSIGQDISFLWRKKNPYAHTNDKILKILQPVSFGVTFYNVLSLPLKLKESRERYPIIISSSISYRFKKIFNFINTELGLGWGMVPQYKEHSLNIGLELIIWKIFYMRNGYKISDQAFSIGTGIKAWDMMVDFGLSTLEINKNFYTLNLKIKF